MFRLLFGVVMVTLLTLSLTSAPSEAGEPLPDAGHLAVTTTPTPTPWARPAVPHWFPAQLQPPVQHVFCLDNRRCWAHSYVGIDYGSTQRSTLHVTKDGGWTWESFEPTVISHFPFGLFFVSPERGFSYGQFTHDGGRSWQRLLLNGQPSAHTFPATGLNVYACTSEYPQHTWRSTDGGATWSHWADGCPTHRTQFLDGQVAWAPNDPPTNRARYTTDGWQTSREVDVVPGGTAEQIVFWNHAIGWARGKDSAGTGYVLRTEDGGAS